MTDPEMRAALEERRELIEARAAALVDAALADPASWAAGIGAPPPQSVVAGAWRKHLVTVVAYRDRYGIDSADPLGVEPDGVSQRLDRERASAALDRARQAAAQARQSGSSRPAPARERRGPTR